MMKAGLKKRKRGDDVDDNIIIDLYFARDEMAIDATMTKYGRLLHSIAYNILRSDDESEECVNDTYVKAWGVIPPERPSRLSAFLAKITRNISINRYVKRRSQNRIIATEVILDEIMDCVPSTDAPISDDIELKNAINGFLESLDADKRIIFVRRYWYMYSIKDIARSMGYTVSNVKVTLMRTREQFRAYLEKAGISI